MKYHNDTFGIFSERTLERKFQPRGEFLYTARKRLLDELPSGSFCPCCDQFAKLYKRKINSGMVVGLFNFYREYGLSFGHYSAIGKTGFGDFTKLRYWGLIEAKAKGANETEKKNSGIWRVTKKGEQFLKNNLEVSSYVKIYNSDVYGFSGEKIKVKKALSNKFNYAELMREEN